MADQALAPLPEDWQRALAIVAHPDDLEYGTASAVARWTSDGKDVRYVVVTRGEAGLGEMPPEHAGPLREAEERRSAAVVGVHTVEFLGYHDGVIEYGLPLRRDLARVIASHRPQVVLSANHRATWGGSSFNMADHRHVGLAVLDAVRDAANRWIFPELVDEDLEPWSGVFMVAFHKSPKPTHAVDVTGFLDQGIASLREHRSYLEHVGTDADAMLRREASAAGPSLGVEHAVTFEVVRP